jgi:hypothetical protein
MATRAEVVAVDGYRLLVPAIWLWFHADDAVWRSVEQALAAAGIRTERVDGVTVYEGHGLAIEYRPDNHRLSLELTHEAGREAVDALLALLGAAGEPDLETGNCWLWSPRPFRVRGQDAHPARRIVRAARWHLPRERLADAVAALAAGSTELAAAGMNLHMALTGGVRLEVYVAERQAPASVRLFEGLLAALGEPEHIAHVTVAA